MSARLPDGAPTGASQDSANTSLVILMPVYNDWDVLRLLLESLDRALVTAHETAAIVVVNDASPIPPNLTGLQLQAIRQLEVLHLRRNLGHQRAICIGLAHVEANTTFDNILIMDADGEDRPSDVVRMLEKSRDEAAG